MENKRFAKGEVIFRQGDTARTMYDIESGSVGIYAWYGTEKETHLVTFGPGSVFGEIELIESCTRGASAVALEDGTEAWELTREDLGGYFADKPEKVLDIMRQVSRRVRETTQSYLDACRTVYETVETEKSGGKLSAWLEEHLTLLYRIGRLLKI